RHVRELAPAGPGRGDASGRRRRREGRGDGACVSLAVAPRHRFAAIMRRFLIAALGAIGIALGAGVAVAAPTVVSTRPVSDDTGAKVHFLVGGIEESGRSLKMTDLAVSVDGQLTTPLAV